MGNNDDKTFTDLFSNSNNGLESEGKTFADIFNSSVSFEKDDAISTNVTFDNLKDEVVNEEVLDEVEVKSDEEIEQNE